MSSGSNKEVVTAFMERFSSGDIDYAHELLAENFEWEIPGNLAMAGLYDKKAFREVNEFLVKTFTEPPKWIPDSMTAENDKVAVEAHSIGDTKEGVAYRNRYHLLLTVADGKITRGVEYMDTKHVQEFLDSAGLG
ncbi:nuclear transport factor 2 family protein [Arthrobacter sp. ISL-28]|uniref:nuclear transport factor 2 family protein n=1 Tax=Arthrobacter sp. ISL-28 TaxID=2819108 RepID=UPI001BECA3B4|nr:nuclear transport factor 2 family protein [Arthrobacter sp. ISL-28]MBT2523444.1 nuclear transport factor 2 family protein [Arthrobacter sp. ISL-28]